ncbi:MAG TPA: hypothetical protein VFQ39_09770, partial [Longimicrobium sp.]|nr:hypothetical protein [Longimicrobium sp.]
MNARTLARPGAALLASFLVAASAAAQQLPIQTPAGQPASNGGRHRGAHAERPAVKAVARTAAVVVDGKLDEAMWATAPAASGFTQQDPHEGQPATQPTEVRFVYDNDALYIGARMR